MAQRSSVTALVEPGMQQGFTGRSNGVSVPSQVRSVGRRTCRREDSQGLTLIGTNLIRSDSIIRLVLF